MAQIGDGLAAIPADARTQEQLEWLAEEIDEAGGTSTLWRAQLTSAAQERAVVQELASARTVEYVDIRRRAQIAAGTSMEAPEAERVLRSLRRELRQVHRRDFFPPPERESARAAIDALAQSLRSRVDHDAAGSEGFVGVGS